MSRPADPLLPLLKSVPLFARLNDETLALVAALANAPIRERRLLPAAA